ncbi:hypothetical protein [Paenibacillus sp. PvR148]
MQMGNSASPEAYHMQNYRGNQPGHDQGLRGDSFYPAQQQGGTGYETNYSTFRYGVRGNEAAYNNVNNVSSQFGGGFTTSAPVNGGFGSSFAGQGIGSSISRQNFGSSFGQGSYAQGQPSAEAYHMQNYRGNQPGHDQGLRGDSLYPAQQQGGAGYEANYGSFGYGVRGNEAAYNNVNNVSSQFGGGYATSAPVNGFGMSMAGQSTFR